MLWSENLQFIRVNEYVLLSFPLIIRLEIYGLQMRYGS